MNKSAIQSAIKRKAGFTIVELIIVIVVIGILAGIVIIAYGAWQSRLASDVVKSDLTNVVSAMENTRNFGDVGYPSAVPASIVGSNKVTLAGGGRPGGKTFCVEGTSTATTKKFYVSNKQVDPIEGSCTMTSVAFAGSGASGYVNAVGTAASFSRIEGIGVAQDGTVYAADEDHLRRIATNGAVSLYDGTGSDGFTSGVVGADMFNAARGVAVDSSGNIYVLAINNNAIYKITPDGVKTVHTPGIHGTDLILGKDNNFYALVGDNYSGKLFVTTMAGGTATLIAGNATNATVDGQGAAASLHDPRSLARASDGTIYICETGSGLVRKVSPSNYVSTYAGSGSSYAGGATSPINGWCGGVAVDSSDILYVAAGNKLQTIDKNGTVTDFATISGAASSVAIDNDGNIFIGTGRVLYKIIVP
ncbi:MAG: prepilin-type N-terminal cleavage/methylation domain-containing protein [Patescibacteria group bacterium]